MKKSKKNSIVVAPLVYIESTSDARTATLIGISSWSGACGFPEYPDVHGRVSKIIPWIRSLNLGLTSGENDQNIPATPILNSLLSPCFCYKP